jgi:hypothetical protein
MSLFSKWSGRRGDEASTTVAEPVEPLTTSKVLPKFLSALSQVEAPVLLDLGPVVGQNVAFFGDRLSCKLHVEDLLAVVETYARNDNRAAVVDGLAQRLDRVNGPVDGILCWDLFDYLDRKAAPVVAAALVKLLREGGVLHGFFATKALPVSAYTRFIVEAPDQFRQRAYPAAPTTRTVFVTRDLQKMFTGLAIKESVLLKNNTQEVLLKR